MRVLLPLPLAGAYDYLLPAGLDSPRGAIVKVPLGKRLIHGVVWGEAAGDVADDRLKMVVRRYPTAPLPETVLALVDWVAA
ncbi:MAG: primosomal protein N', partial [Pseudomonadota bacterium]|nr:primosomal protein N' [Pseudomonadota bacterium]